MSQGQHNVKNLAYYRNAFLDIKVYKNLKKGGEALNQPILLLSIIELISQGLLQENCIAISDELIETFKKYWVLLVPNDPFENSDFALPFFHLKNRHPKFWHLKFSKEYEGGRPQTINTLKKGVDYSWLDDELFSFLQDSMARQELIDALIAGWFASSQKELEEILKINQDFQDSTDEVLDNIDESNQINKAPKFYLKKSLVRDAFFRKSVVHLYDYKCAFCRLKVTHSLSQNIVDGAHIQPFSIAYNSQINNGLSLCKNHHWAFDRGWFTIDDKYKIIISKYLQEDSPYTKPMKDFENEVILLPNSEKYLPSLQMIDWHRQNVFQSE
jgi:putative restriction endonuclease